MVIFWDTGAPKNICSQRTYNLFFSHIEMQDTGEVGLCDIQGGNLKTVGKFSLTFELAGIPVTEEIYVSEGIQLAGQILIGFPAMVRHQISIDPAIHGIVIQGRRQPFYCPGISWSYTINEDIGRTQPVKQQHSPKVKSILKRRTVNETRHVDSVDFPHAQNLESDGIDKIAVLNLNLSQNETHSISSRRNLVLKPGQTSLLRCKVNNCKHGGNFNIITLPESQKIKGVSIESSLHNVKRNSVIISVANNLDNEINIHKGSLICDTEMYKFPVLEVDEITPQVEKTIANFEIDKQHERKKSLEYQLNEVDFPDAREKLVKLLLKYDDIIALKGDTLGVTDKIKHHISVPRDTPPIYIPAYRVAHSQKQNIEKEVEKMLEQGIIKESDTPWSFPLLCVPKKDKTLRVVVDFRRLNDLTATDPYPMPSMRDLLTTIGHNKVFSTIDLLQGFHQIYLDEESSNMTGFSSGSRHYKFQ